MKPLLGFILIDPTEITIRIYQAVEENNWQVLYHNNYPLAVQDAKVFETIKVLEVITEVFSDVSGLGVGEWSIYSRGMEIYQNTEISHALNIKIEPLCPQKEVELLFNGFLKESTD